MSPATKSKSKSKEKPSAKATQEQQKASPTPSSAYNPLSRTFHSLDTAPVTVAPSLYTSGRFRNIDETEDHSSSSHGTVLDYDSLSNNGNGSGESEDHKEKVSSTTALRQETIIPGSDNDKREKIRQKNEKKHQRQKERRAQELHERCCGYLMSRKLESLSQQIVAMGFTSERATMALMLNQGRLQESVNWLFEGSEEETLMEDFGIGGANLKIDISQELARIAEMEEKHNCSKQEVERVVISFEGDLEKADVTLSSTQKPEEETHADQSKAVEPTDSSKHTIRPQEKPSPSMVTTTQLLNRNEKEIAIAAYPKGGPTMSVSTDPGSRNMQHSLKTINPSKGSVPYSSTSSPIQVGPTSAKFMAQVGVGGGGMEGIRNIQQGGTVREPVVMMQRPQSMNMKQNPVVTNNSIASPRGTTNQWYGNNLPGVESMRLIGNNNLVNNQSSGNFGRESLGPHHFHPEVQSNRGVGPNNLSSRQYNPQAQYAQHAYTSSSDHNPSSWQFNPQQTHYSEHAYMSSSMDPAVASRPLSASYRTVGPSSPSLTVPSSLGLFSGWGSTATSGPPSHADWNARDMMTNCDYNSIDWTLESNSTSSSNLNDLMLGGRSSSLMSGLSSMRIGSTSGPRVGGLQDSGRPNEAATSGGGVREWSSPFAGKDIFSLPRQFVTYPSP